MGPSILTERLRIAFSLVEPAEVDLRIVDIQGRCVRTLLSGRTDRGQHVIHWDGLTQAGTPATSGVYFLRLNRGKRTDVRRVVVVQ